MILALISLFSCSSKPLQNIVAIKIDTKDTTIDILTSKPDAVFTKKFLNYLIEKFPTASNVIFYPYDSTNSGIFLSDSTYEFGIISDRNKTYLINSLPKNLSKEERDNYFKQSGLFVYEDSADLAKRDSLFEERTKWTKPPSSIEVEFLKFYPLIKSKNQYLIIAPKSYLDSAQW